MITGVTRTKKSARAESSTSGVGVAGRRGKRKRPLVEEDEEDDDETFTERSDGLMVEGREGYVNGLLKQLIKVHVLALYHNYYYFCVILGA